ncbi:subclass B1 metallo-beta-lactamase [Carboxylicivirga sediminis]|uniref:beta-lactamase n=1 Tax=Carboxylicivirga sediminis TaxID=2006564 RepID=A0A941IWF0_9BACT|nr:subclass B1 metallo-beta-lactamase [Carboxylicivirga sediminis]MBR8534344.1 subclass B1 metallo-beta-lactamase [Carboxylicivirga sediminis]
MMSRFVSASLLLLLFLPLRAQYPSTQINEDLELIHLQDSVFVHVSWVNSETYGRFSCNGIVIVRNSEAVLIDTPMSNEQTKQLCDYLVEHFKVTIRALIAGHYHDDCIGGLEYLHSIGARSLACQLTIDKCEEEGLAIPKIAFDKEYDCLFNNELIECRFFGPGHSFDNITVWLPQQKILFGGCLIKSAQSKGLGNLSDANIDEWSTTIEKIQYAYPDAKLIVPGHGQIGNSQLLSHTITLIKKQKKE